uniref:Sec20 C-terminal domain-containing protein n=1 Tax=Pyramimonas obovata TaxID=1411642 RepID=A0A7S0QQL4_9CHLO|mmetsp:Transcript_15594/g.33800  ORF Transcript_15594/g.33800 Transcript_15594/m.33800 type:complete len:247 (+) Transcript_15594:345-1085(+)|eukprot:CAMPEP_0118940806 /NCGR_PEP_ID=MMETSP1169-20130426/32378_1 /TAXON_ID=36882 /ORGANISM="Pyramimonas obovata, Strain CCMP722" /LENGTH=246 /DNA_ID=CAMNT_0006885401 /DNA_START=273 /DNA_END=1013 /DNA_ORIENTATION=+
MPDLLKEASSLASAFNEKAESVRGDIATLKTYSAGDPRISGLTSSVRDRLALMRKYMEELDILVDEQDRKSDADLVRAEHERCTKEYQNCKRSLKEAFVSNTVKAVEDERAALLDGSSDAKQKQKQTEAEMEAAAEEVTTSLRRTRQLMMQEVEHTARIASVMSESNVTLEKADKEFASQNPLLKSSKRLLSYLKQQEVMDRVILFACFFFFLLVVLHILLKRVPLLNALHPYNWWTSAAQAKPEL